MTEKKESRIKKIKTKPSNMIIKKNVIVSFD